MRLSKTILVGALVCSVGMLSVAGCSDEDEPANPTGGTGGGGSGGGGSGGGGSGGRGGSSGSGGASGSAGSDGGMCVATDTMKADCKARGADSGTCTALVNCSCDGCVCQLQACEADPGCLAIRQCATRTGCCSPVDNACIATGRPTCNTPASECNALITDAGTTTTNLISALSLCVYNSTTAGGAGCTNTVCSDGGGTSDAGGSDASDSGGGG
jgi:hypothetical protein